ncbi:MAG: F0F1 ATP synthase subunit alpha [Candidatus Niyogibacteria bacterium]|nr:F0F1 ATP synthase subunit alpha [Candidatus Niyogibacteria bacterium]
MQKEAKEIIAKLQKEIEAFKPEAHGVKKIGRLTEVKDGVARIAGLSGCLASEMIKLPHDNWGLAMNLEENEVGAIVIGDYKLLKEGDAAESTGEVLNIDVGAEFLGRVVDALGRPLDGRGVISGDKKMPVEKIAPGVITRQSVSKPVQTGIKAIDGIIPVGRGQRELIIGDRQTGKTAIAVDAIINQKGQDMICIYCSVGQKDSKVAKLVSSLEKAGAMEYTIVVNASSSAPAPLQYLAPYSATAIGEYFMEQGRDVLVIYDDLSKHAWAYRQIALLLRRPPGREAYPGDVFYLHSRLLERSACMAPEFGGGSLTALPIIETQAGDVSAYIPTNVISITDGQIYLDPDLFYAGIRPAVSVGLSVSRVGSSAQTKAMKSVAGKLKLDLAQYSELAAFAQFEADLDEATKEKLERGKRIVEILKQDQMAPMALADQVLALYAVSRGLLDDVPVREIKKFEHGFLDFANSTKKELMKELASGSGKIAGDLEEKMKAAIGEFKMQISK